MNIDLDDRPAYWKRPMLRKTGDWHLQALVTQKETNLFISRLQLNVNKKRQTCLSRTHDLPQSLPPCILVEPDSLHQCTAPMNRSEMMRLWSLSSKSRGKVLKCCLRTTYNVWIFVFSAYRALPHVGALLTYSSRWRCLQHPLKSCGGPTCCG